MLVRGVLAFALLGVLTHAGCTKPNPDYCSDSSTCLNGTQCNLQTHTCEVPQDAGTPDAPCTVSPHQGCADTAACRVDSCVQGNEQTECSAIGSGASRSACTGHADCAASYACSGELCRRYCASTADCEAPGGECIDLTCGSPENGTNVCTENCDPIPFVSECPSGYACRLKATRPAFTSCGPAGSANGGDSCTDDADCRQGYACLGSGTFSCQRLCVVGGAPCDVAAANGCIAIPDSMGGQDTMLGSRVMGYCSN